MDQRLDVGVKPSSPTLKQSEWDYLDYSMETGPPVIHTSPVDESMSSEAKWWVCERENTNI